MPDTYTSQFSGEEIDAALRAAQIISGEEIDAALRAAQIISGADTPAALREKLEIYGSNTALSPADPTTVETALKYRSNPNLLDNWYFGNPVNQRGKTEYTAGGVYTLDRWMSSTTTKTIKILDDHLSIVDTADYGAFLQRFEYKGLLGRTVTLSALAKRTAQGAQNPYITVMIGNNKFEGYGEIVQSDDYQLSSCTATLPATAPSEGYFFADIVGMAGSSVDIKAAKLELGDTQTLAHKENGVWVLNEIPDYGEQLRRCQRYALKIEGGKAYGWTYNTNSVNVFIPTPVTMRAVPSLVLDTKHTGSVNTVNGDVAITSIGGVTATSNGVSVDLNNSNSAFTIGTPVVWFGFEGHLTCDL